MLISYAQNFEDVILWRALKHVENGFYIDIGAQDPVVDSVSRGFYEKGWRGVHVEPTATYAGKLRENRPDERVLQAAIGKGGEKLRFFEIPETGLSTGDPEIAEEHRARGFEIVETAVPLMPLSAVLDEIGDREVHWLKIDVEGMEKSVIESWLPSKGRPWVVVVESTVPLGKETVAQEWEALILSLGYEFVYFDGLNRFYVHRERAELKTVFGPGPNVFDDYRLAHVVSHVDQEKIETHINELKLEAEKLEEAKLAAEQREQKWWRLADQLARNQESEREFHRSEMQLLQAREEALEQRINDILSSRSWRLTKPYRMIGRIIGRDAEGGGLASVKHSVALKTLAFVRKHPATKAVIFGVLEKIPALDIKVRRFALHHPPGVAVSTENSALAWRSQEVIDSNFRSRRNAIFLKRINEISSELGVNTEEGRGR
ncbi:hypothetical protein ATN84_00515 [Paramesorhizobium deserti]|uniref:Methyltransferase FkbM domain-containing protein n=2 Tax=Paramesorhizobium deserti TaxID=1494590 RepID=A0A135HYP6_9HYPH|nr:hypothetical protein ATN84_00515 [Paramesorhizobium deserti]